MLLRRFRKFLRDIDHIYEYEPIVAESIHTDETIPEIAETNMPATEIFDPYSGCDSIPSTCGHDLVKGVSLKEILGNEDGPHDTYRSVI